MNKKLSVWLTLFLLASSAHGSELPQITELSEDLENSEISYSLKSSPRKNTDLTKVYDFDEASELIDYSKVPEPGDMVMVEDKDGKSYRYGILKTRADQPVNEQQSDLNKVTIAAAICSGIVHIGAGILALALII